MARQAWLNEKEEAMLAPEGDETSAEVEAAWEESWGWRRVDLTGQLLARGLEGRRVRG